RTARRSQDGLGIGLTLARLVAELHGGTIEAHSDGEGHGSEFRVRLPVLLAPEAEGPVEAPPTHREPARTTALRILVVDDNVDAATSLSELLSLSGHDCRVARDGASALRMAETLRPDVVFLDIGLPEMNGYDVARELRRHDWGRALRLVALTGWGQADDRARSRDAGFDHHLVKPVEYAVVESLLGAEAASV
ncbi:MAG TPA: response regulator, partial [Candidatus Limnocylindria bacterium]|nr:response regulator [Candidatus Limnocylindria bacterium]